MRVLVAGWHGQIAFALTEAAARRAEVSAYAVGRQALDLTDHPSIGRTLFGIAPDVIINTAAYSDVEGAELDPENALRRNKLGSAALAAEAARIGIPIIHLSTVYVFDGQKASPYVETDAVAPINAYGRSKAAAEAAVTDANPKHIILRTGWVYSPFHRNFVTNLLKPKSDQQAPLSIDAFQRGSPTYAPHLAEAILDIASHVTTPMAGPTEVPPWGTYHAADAEDASWCELAEKAFNVSAMHGNTHPSIEAVMTESTSNRAARPRNAVLDCSKLKAAFGILLPNWRDAVEDCIKRIQNDQRAT